MKIVAAFDSFKGSMTSVEAGNAFSDGVKRVDKDIEVYVRPLADGGEGTVDAIIAAMKAKKENIIVTGPLGKPVDCNYGIISETRTAVIEMSSAAGITLLSNSELNPLKTTTYGVGEIIIDAIKKGCRRFIVGIGGSATNDGGVGMLQALGYDFLDASGRKIELGASGLQKLACIDDFNVIPELNECEFIIACDVDNPLCGENGCSNIYGPQKGATKSMIEEMDAWLSHYAKLAKDKYPKADSNFPGSGAAGGMGFAFNTFTNSELKSGIDIVMEESRLEDYIKDADFVVTGEGMIDAQTIMGKVPVGVARIAKKYHKPVIAFAGGVTPDARICNKYGIDAFFPIVRGITTLDNATFLENAKANMSDTAEQVIRLINTKIY